MIVAWAWLLPQAAAGERRLDFDGREFAFRGGEGLSHRLELSEDLRSWRVVHAVRGERQWSWSDPDLDGGGAGGARRYYRVVEVGPPTLVPHRSWKTSVHLPEDPFLSQPVGGSGEVELRWVKFLIVLDGLPTVIFQDSAAYPFHFPFAVERIAPFVGMGAAEFERVSLYPGSEQQVVLGAVLWAPGRAEFGVQFVGAEAYPREFVRLLYRSVEGSLSLPAGARGFYVPTAEQAEAARADQQYLAANGIEVAGADRWAVGGACYAEGWAIGRMVFVAGGEIEDAYRSGMLRPADILVTDMVPAEIPFVAGVITFAATTPNSHVVILSRSYGIPFAHLADESGQARVMELAAAGEPVVVRSLRDLGGRCDLRVVEVGGVDAEFRAALEDLKAAPELAIEPVSGHGSIVWGDLATATVADIGRIGGKAANFGVLRREIPGNSPEAIAFTFDLWTAYLDQRLAGGGTLRDAIESQLAPFAWPPADMAALDAALVEVRRLVRREADFSGEQRAAVLGALTAAGFDPLRKLRVRSSTNVEDSEHFVGAGLYDSYSGCLQDDLDDDDIGPSHCDPDEPDERGVLRAMRKVYASFYNLNAFIERLRHGVDESQVGMALLVHHSFPDEIEAANGVGTGSLGGSPTFWSFPARLVSQVGATSVTNPGGGSLPEVVDVDAYRGRFGSGASPTLVQRSSLLQLGRQAVLDWPRDYEVLTGLLMDVAIAAGEANAGGELEFEYKKLTDGSLVVKQVRRVPVAPSGGAEFAALVNAPTTWRVFQGEYGSVFGNHLLKSLWAVESDSRWLDAAGLASPLLTRGDLTWAPDGMVVERHGPPSAWPHAGFELVEQFGRREAVESWRLPAGAGDAEFELRLVVPEVSGTRAAPVFFADDFGAGGGLDAAFNARYPEQRLDFEHGGEPLQTSEFFARLEPGGAEDPPQQGSLPQRRSVDRAVDVDIAFYWPPAPTGIVAGYTAPLEAWDETVITGLTSGPIVLRGYFSQTYRPEHHNFSEHFLFEPALEPGLDPAVLAELQALDVRYVYVYVAGGASDRVMLVGADGQPRQVR